MKRHMSALVAISVAVVLITAMAGCGTKKELKEGESWEVAETTRLSSLTVAEGAVITAPEGKSLTLTVDGVETGQKLLTTMGVDMQIEPGTYQGDVVLTITDANPVVFKEITFPLRQALYLDETGVVEGKSVLAAASFEKASDFNLADILIASTGECFNGIYVAGGDYTLRNVTIDFDGNGRNDFAGYGAAIVGIGEGTRLVLDDADIKARGTVRTGLIANGGSNVIVKNSTIETFNGVLPEDYTPSVNMAEMRGGLGGAGNVRATNLLGTNTRAAYINSAVLSEGWGCLSLDDCTTPVLTVINSRLAHTGGKGGYGTYDIGDGTETFLGVEFDVQGAATVMRSGTLLYADSTPEAVAKLNADLDLGLTDEELAALPVKHTTVKSGRFGINCAGGGSVVVKEGTTFDTQEAVFMVKGRSANITVDGSQGASLSAANGIIMQIMDDDDPGPTMPAGTFDNPYIEPDTPPEKDESWDVTSVENATSAIFSNIQLTGDFYNSTGWTKMASTGGPGGGMPMGEAGGPGREGSMPPQGGMPDGTNGEGGMDGPSAVAGPDGEMMGPGGGGMFGGGAAGGNMALTFDNACITGIISSSEAHHPKKVMYMVEDYKLFSKVTNTASPAINNGVIVSLTNGATWTVTGTSYLTRLTIAGGSQVTAPEGRKITMTVDGVETPVTAGTYEGGIVLTVASL